MKKQTLVQALGILSFHSSLLFAPGSYPSSYQVTYGTAPLQATSTQRLNTNTTSFSNKPKRPLNACAEPFQPSQALLATIALQQNLKQPTNQNLAPNPIPAIPQDIQPTEQQTTEQNSVPTVHHDPQPATYENQELSLQPIEQYNPEPIDQNHLDAIQQSTNFELFKETRLFKENGWEKFDWEELPRLCTDEEAMHMYANNTFVPHVWHILKK